MDAAKAASAKLAVDHFIINNQQLYSRLQDKQQSPVILGIGSGSTIIYAVQYLGSQLTTHANLICIASSHQAEQLIMEQGFHLGSLQQYPILDVYLDGADVVDAQTGTCIKGGGGALLREKLLAQAARLFVVCVDERKWQSKSLLGKSWFYVPCEVLAESASYLKRIITEKAPVPKGASVWQPKIRQAGSSKAGPAVTDNGHLLLDLYLPENENSVSLEHEEAVLLNQFLLNLSGVLETGLFIQRVDWFCVAYSNGKTEIMASPLSRLL